jgi:hypothetical protein
MYKSIIKKDTAKVIRMGSFYIGEMGEKEINCHG